jgi:hypothetical protein
MLIIAHISLMIAATLCLCAGVGFAMFGRKKNSWLKWHKKLNLAGYGLLVAGAAAAFANVAASDGIHLAGRHHQAGLAAFMLTGITVVLGFHALKAANKPAARARHRWSGRLSLTSILFTLIVGLRMIGIL